MTTQVQLNAEIEGKKLSGDSRDPIRNRGLCRINNKEYHSFIANDNSNAVIIQSLSNEEPISQTSSRLVNDNISNVAQISLYSTSNKYTHSVENKTGRHKTNCWDFKKHTLAKISKPNPTTINSMQKRLKNEKHA